MAAIPTTMPPARQEFSDHCNNCRQYGPMMRTSMTFRDGCGGFTVVWTLICFSCDSETETREAL